MSTTSDEIRQAVRANYREVALQKATEGEDACGCSTTSSCCSDPSAEISLLMGYTPEELAAAPEGANMGLGCGNPQAIANLRQGETVLDLGSGGGFDCLLASRQVGETGRVIGVDMTPEMISKARHIAAKGGFTNVEYRLGEIEHLPVADNSVDVIISNCVINLSPEKAQVFREAFRVLKPGGRLAVSDIVTTATLPDDVRSDMALYTECVAGAASIDELKEMLRSAGFVDVRIEPKDESRELIRDWIPGSNAADYILSAAIEGRKPAE